MRIERANEMTGSKAVIDVLKERASVPPPLLYKYYAFNKWTPRIFQNNELYFRSANDFNDPFDSIVRFVCEGSRQQRKRVLERNWEDYDPGLSRKQRQNFMKRYKTKRGSDELAAAGQDQLNATRKRAGVFCTAETRDDILMWSHYAESHTGFCLAFKTEDPFFQSVRPVSYDCSGRVPCVNAVSDDDEIVASLVKALLTKAMRWEYEHEWRIIDLDNGAGPRQFPPKVLHAVILGCRIHDDDRKRMLEWCKGRSPRPILYQARVKETEYGLDIEPVEY